MQVRLIPPMPFRVETLEGADLGTFTIESEWNGLKKLVNNKGQAIIGQNEPPGLSIESIERVLGIGGPSEVLDVFLASPALLKIITDSKDGNIHENGSQSKCDGPVDPNNLVPPTGESEIGK